MGLKNKNRKLKTFTDYLLAITLVAVVDTISWFIFRQGNYHVVSLILLFLVSILATFLNTWVVLSAATLSALSWNYFFIPPHFTFHIESTEDILIFFLFFIIALLNAILTSRVKNQETLARERENRTNSLFKLTSELSKAKSLNEVIQLSIKQINAYFDVKPLFVLQDGNNNLSESGRIQKMIKLSAEDYEIAKWVFTNNKEAGAFTNNYQNTENTFYPLKTNIVSPGVLIIKHYKKLSGSKKDFWDTFITLISNALEREFLREIAEKARFLDESDRLYKTLFNSLSHEFRIPVATIMGASESIISSTDASGIQKSLMDEILTASLRLNRLVENLLNISRLENDRISPRLDWYDLNDIINEVIDALENELKEYELIVDINEKMPLIKVDFGLLEQVIYNVILNSIQHSPTNTGISIFANHKNETLYLTISDQGKGFNTENTLNVFNKFFRDSGNVSGGLGLGLSIVKGFIEAHKGKVNARNNESGGALIEISIPSKKPVFNDKYDLSDE